MGTVFLVLIFISLIIGSLKYVNAAGANTKPEAAPAAAPAPVAAAPVAAVPANNLMNDLELVAVITAAIAASTGTSADGLVVRSIKRKSGSTWKRN
ncbi:MAG: OadG family protein [Lachnospiraceae bacterium]